MLLEDMQVGMTVIGPGGEARVERIVPENHGFEIMVSYPIQDGRIPKWGHPEDYRTLEESAFDRKITALLEADGEPDDERRIDMIFALVFGGHDYSGTEVLKQLHKRGFKARVWADGSLELRKD